jgi:hypothetical protein
MHLTKAIFGQLLSSLDGDVEANPYQAEGIFNSLNKLIAPFVSISFWIEQISLIKILIKV